MTDKDLAVEQEQDSDLPVEELSESEKLMAALKEAITVEREEVGSLRVKLTVTVPRDLLDERLGEQFAELRRDAIVPGFRKGHAPIKLVEKRFASDVADQLKGQLLSSGFLAATEKEDIKPLGDPMIWVTVKESRTGEDGRSRQVEAQKLLSLEDALDHFNLPKEGPLQFACEVELKPEFELPALEGIPVQQPQITVNDEDVDAELRRVLAMHGTYQPVEDDVVQRDDLLYVDLKMTVDGEVLVDEQNQDLPARDVRIKGVPATGLGDALTGQKREAQVTLEAQIPDENEDLALRGKTARFDITIREIKRWVLPTLDAEFLANVGLESEEQFRGHLRSRLEAEIHRAIRQKMLTQVAEHLVDQTKLEVPEGLSQRQSDRLVERKRIELFRAGIPESEVNKHIDDLQASAREQSVRDLKLFFILERIAEDREVDVSEEDLNGAIADIARSSGRRFDRVRDDLSKNNGLMSLYLRLRDEKVLESLLVQAAITEAPPEEEEGPKKEPAKKGGRKSGKSKKADEDAT